MSDGCYRNDNEVEETKYEKVVSSYYQILQRKESAFDYLVWASMNYISFKFLCNHDPYMNRSYYFLTFNGVQFGPYNSAEECVKKAYERFGRK